MADYGSVLIGTLGKPHGLRGELTVFLRTDEPERRFAPGAEVLLDGRTTRVTSMRWNGGILLVGLAGVGDRTGAERLRGTDVWVRVALHEAPTEDDEFYDRQLLGLEVRDTAGSAVGRVAAVRHAPAQDLLVVDVDGAERLVPFVAELVPQVDVEAGYLSVADVPGLLHEVDE